LMSCCFPISHAYKTACKRHFRQPHHHMRWGSPRNTADRSEDISLQVPLFAGVLYTRPVEGFDVMLFSHTNLLANDISAGYITT
jgi:hypothetical protein